jgi:divalent metal cation (Fe/Co/Zn/Cd) transporter
VTSGVLALVGLYLLYDALSKLLHQQRPAIGLMVIAGHHFWAGWGMIGALSYSLFCGLLIGILKKPVAKKLNCRALFAESTMNRDEWMSEGAAILGILLVAFGHWWGDAAAAAFISIEIVHDGWMNMRLVIGDLMDEAPTRLGTHDLEDVTEKVLTSVRSIDRVAHAAVRLREHGRALTGQVLVVPRDGTDVLALVNDVVECACEVDWRIHDLAVMPVARIDSISPPRATI